MTTFPVCKGAAWTIDPDAVLESAASPRLTEWRGRSFCGPLDSQLFGRFENVSVPSEL